MTGEEPTAISIAKEKLVRSSEAIKADDFEAFSAMFMLPHFIDTPSTRLEIATIEEARKMFDAVQSSHRQRHITDMVRNCLAADYVDDDTIHTTHESRLISSGQIVEGPYPVFTIFKRVNGEWLIQENQFDVVDPVFTKARGVSKERVRSRDVRDLAGRENQSALGFSKYR